RVDEGYEQHHQDHRPLRPLRPRAHHRTRTGHRLPPPLLHQGPRRRPRGRHPPQAPPDRPGHRAQRRRRRRPPHPHPRPPDRRHPRPPRPGSGTPRHAQLRAAARKTAPRHKPHQIAKALELIEDGGVVPTTRTGVYYTVGTEGEIYKTARTGCTCKAGINGRYACYHRIAVEIVEATYQPAAYQLIRTPIALGLAA